MFGEIIGNISGFMYGKLLVINLPAICIAGGTALKTLDDYTKQKREGKSPVFKAETVGLKGNTDYWQ